MVYIYNKDIKIPANGEELKGRLVLPQNASAIIIFSHGSGSSYLSPRNIQVAEYLHHRKFGTLLFDLLTEDEGLHYYNRFDIDLLTSRLINATDWLIEQPYTEGKRMGYFGASTGAASALQAAATQSFIGAVVSRGGRPDMAIEMLHKVQAPTLLIVGSRDMDVLKLNQMAFEKLNCEKKLEIISGASHLFEEYGTLEKVCQSASAWFTKYLQPVGIEH